jgi:ferritin-like metal-binding protein YciE
MEMHAVSFLERQQESIENYPLLAGRIAQHREETLWQISQLERCLGILGAEPSTIKNVMGTLSANMGAMGTMFASDEILKDSIASTAFEHLEIASYKVIIAAAEQAGEAEIARLCQGILDQEVAMAAWLEEHLPETTAQFLQRAAAGQPAKA